MYTYSWGFYLSQNPSVPKVPIFKDKILLYIIMIYNKQFLTDFCKNHFTNKVWEKHMLFKYQDTKNLRVLFDMRYIKLKDSEIGPDSKHNLKYKLLMSKLIKKTPDKFLFITINYDPKKH